MITAVRRFGKRGATIVVTIVLLGALYAVADWRSVIHSIARLDPGYVAAALVLLVPQTLVSAARWRYLATPTCQITLLDSTRHTLAASALNLVVPSKLGDLSKAWMLPVELSARASAVRLVVIEKVFDVTALAAFMVMGFLGIDSRTFVCVAVLLLLISWLLANGPIRTSGGNTLARATPCAAWSIVLWSLHLLQIHWFLLAAGVATPLSVTAARVPLAIFTGLVPVSFWGLGTRDVALVWLFSDRATAATMAAVGALTALRYALPGLAGIALLPRYLPNRSSLAWLAAARRWPSVS